MTPLTIARRFLALAAMDVEGYRDRRAYYARSAHHAGITMAEIAEAYDMDDTDVEAMLREED